jgi:hypothetical protein
MQRASTTGNMTTEGLLKVASTKKSSDKASIKECDAVLECGDMSPLLKRGLVRALQNLAAVGKPPLLDCSSSSHFKNQKIDKR